MDSILKHTMPPKIVNKMVEMRASGTLNLVNMEKRLASLPSITRCNYRPARPCRLYLRWMINNNNSVVIQLFPRGCIQVLGLHEDNVYEHVRDFLAQQLPSMTLSLPVIKSMTVSLRWCAFNLNTLHSNARISNEHEIFPATLISHPARFNDREHHCHCALFPSGSAIVTGVTSISQAQDVLTRTVHDLMLNKELIPYHHALKTKR